MTAEKLKNRGWKAVLGTAAAMIMLLCLPAAAWGEKTVTLTFAGDCTLGSEEQKRDQEDSFISVSKKEGFDYFFRYFRDLFSEDDCTVVNFEGVLADSPAGEVKNKTYRFRAPAEYAKILTGASVEAAGLANNHTGDYGAQGLKRTQEALEAEGICWFREKRFHIVEKDGIRIALVAMDYRVYVSQCENIRNEIARVRESGEANAVVLLYHDGNEYDARHTQTQDKVATYFINNGVDLVIMHHPHVVQGIEVKNNRTVFYSLGNFVFGGNRQIRTEPYKDRTVSSLYSLVVQAKLYFNDDGSYKGQQMILYPAYTSSAAPINNYQPYRVNTEEALPVLDAIQYDSTTMEIPAANADGEGLARVVLGYLPAEEEPTEAPLAQSENGIPEPANPRPYRNNKP